jgi:hypothetical protein
MGFARESNPVDHRAPAALARLRASAQRQSRSPSCWAGISLGLHRQARLPRREAEATKRRRSTTRTAACESRAASCHVAEGFVSAGAGSRDPDSLESVLVRRLQGHHQIPHHKGGALAAHEVA